MPNDRRSDTFYLLREPFRALVVWKSLPEMQRYFISKEVGGSQ